MVQLWFNTGISGITQPTQVVADSKEPIPAPVKPKISINKSLMASTKPVIFGLVKPVQSNAKDITNAILDLTESIKSWTGFDLFDEKYFGKFDINTLTMIQNATSDLISGSWKVEMQNAYKDQWMSLDIISMAHDGYQMINDIYWWTPTIEEDKPKMWKIEQGIAKFARGVFGRNKLSSEQRQENIDNWNVKTFWQVAFGDMWGAPQVAVWAATAIWDIPWNVVWLFNKEVGDNMKLSSVVPETLKTGWYNAWKIATEIGMSAIAAEAMLWQITKVWQVKQLITQNPNIAKWIAKPLLAWLWYQAATDVLTQGKISSIWQYWISGLAGIVASWVGNLLWMWAKAIKDSPKLYQNAMKNVNQQFIDDIAAQTKTFAENPWAQHPMKTLVTKLDDALTSIQTEKWAVWVKIWAMRSTLKTVSSSTDNIVTTINDWLKWNDIAAGIKKVKGIYKVVGAVAKSEWQWTILKEIATQINWLKQVGMNGKLAWVDKINQYMWYLMKTSKMDGSLKNALWKSSSVFTKQIDDILSNYWIVKWEYAKVAEIQSAVKELTSEWWTAGENLLRKLTSPEKAREVQKLLVDLKDLWYTKDDLLWETLVTNYIMDSIMWPWAFTKAFSDIYLSKPWVIEALIKGWKWLLVNPVKELKRFSSDYVPNATKQSAKRWIQWFGKSAVTRATTELTQN